MKTVLACLAAGCLAAPAWAQSFRDSEFANAGWSVVKAIDTTPSATALCLAEQTDQGNPGECRRIAHNWQLTVPGVSITFAHMAAGSVYNPATQGILLSVGLFFDARADQAPYVGAIGFGPAVRQGGQVFLASGATAIAGAGWIAVGGFYTADMFTLAGGTAHPDFALGAPLEFGFYSSNGGTGATFRLFAEGRVDNFHVRYNRPCGADLNGDNAVDDSDFVLFAAAYDVFNTGAGDLNDDGFTDDADFVLFAHAYDAFICPT